MALVVGCTISLMGCTNQSIKIGLMADLTGRASGLGVASRNGAELAVDEVNKSGGIKGKQIKLIVKDDRGMPSVAQKVDEELMNENILLGIGHMTSNAGLTGLQVFERYHKLMISPLMTTDSLTGKDDDFIRVIGSNKKQSQLLAKAALTASSNKKIATLYEYNNKEYSQEICNFFKEDYEKAGGQIVFEGHYISSQTVDFDSIATKITASGADGVLISCGGIDLAILCQKIKKIKPEIQIYSGMWAMTEDTIVKGGKSLEGALFAGSYYKGNQNPDFISFREGYLQRYHQEPECASLFSYETVKMVADVLKTVKRMDTDSIKKQIINTKKFKGLQGDIIINPYGDSDRGYFLFKVQDANFVRVQ